MLGPSTGARRRMLLGDSTSVPAPRLVRARRREAGVRPVEPAAAEAGVGPLVRDALVADSRARGNGRSGRRIPRFTPGS